MARNLLASAAMAAGIAVGAAGLVLAQDQNAEVAPPAAPVAPPPAEATTNVTAPPPEPAPPPASDDNADQNDAPAPAANVADEAPPPPPKRPRYATAVLQALDKVTADTLRFEAKVDEPVRYKNLVITVHACETSASDETFPEAAAHLDVQDQPDLLPGAKAATARRIYQGWMFARSPGLHPLQHPIYDLWVIACRTPAPAAPGAPGASL